MAAFPLLAVIVAVNPLFSSTGTTELFRIGTQAVYAEGYANAATMALLLLCVMQWFANADAVLGSDKVMGTLGGILPTISLMTLHDHASYSAIRTTRACHQQRN